MAGITLTQAQATLDMWLAAEEAVATSQAYTINGRSMTRANLGEIEAAIDRWDKRVQRLSRGGIRIQGASPC